MRIFVDAQLVARCTDDDSWSFITVRVVCQGITVPVVGYVGERTSHVQVTLAPPDVTRQDKNASKEFHTKNALKVTSQDCHQK